MTQTENATSRTFSEKWGACAGRTILMSTLVWIAVGCIAPTLSYPQQVGAKLCLNFAFLIATWPRDDVRSVR